MNRDGTEAVIWEHAAALNADLITDRCRAMDTIMRAVDDYVTVQCARAISAPHHAEQAARRAILAAASRAHRCADPQPAALGPPPRDAWGRFVRRAA
jgi:hypothetical protein